MKFLLHIDRNAEECVAVTAHAPSPLTDAIEALVKGQYAPSAITVYRDGDIRTIDFEDVECLAVDNNKTIAVLADGTVWQVKQRLYELKDRAPSSFIRINKSAVANIKRLERFSTTYAGGVNAVFYSGYTDYVSRRCFADIKRRLKK